MPEDDGPGYSDLSAPKRQPRNGKSAHIVEGSPESGCNVRTQDPENFDEEVKSLVTAWPVIHNFNVVRAMRRIRKEGALTNGRTCHPPRSERKVLTSL